MHNSLLSCALIISHLADMSIQSDWTITLEQPGVKWLAQGTMAIAHDSLLQGLHQQTSGYLHLTTTHTIPHSVHTNTVHGHQYMINTLKSVNKGNYTKTSSKNLNPHGLLCFYMWSPWDSSDACVNSNLTSHKNLFTTK